MTSPQLIANQANARRSTGPATEEGKARSSQNALRHGLTSKTALLPTEDPEAYRKHCKTFFDRFVHRDEIQRQLIQQLADIQWRLLRVPGIEAAILDEGNIQALATISMYEQRLLRTFEKTLTLLGKLQATQCKKDQGNGFVYTAPRSLLCDDCWTENQKTTKCEHCGSRNLVPEAEYDRRRPHLQERKAADAASSGRSAEITAGEPQIEVQ